MGYAPSYSTFFEVKVKNPRSSGPGLPAFQLTNTRGQHRNIAALQTEEVVNIKPDSPTKSKLSSLKLIFNKNASGFTVLASHNSDQRRQSLSSKLS